MFTANKVNVNNKQRAYEAWRNPAMQDKWLVFDGVQVSFHDSYDTIKEHRGEQAICYVSELGNVFSEDSHLTWNQLLHLEN